MSQHPFEDGLVFDCLVGLDGQDEDVVVELGSDGVFASGLGVQSAS